MEEKMNIENLLLPETQDATVADENVALTYKFEAFEGPLDLLLSLITKNKIDIYDICIEDLLNQYMEQINLMKEEDMDRIAEAISLIVKGKEEKIEEAKKIAVKYMESIGKEYVIRIFVKDRKVNYLRKKWKFFKKGVDIFI